MMLKDRAGLSTWPRTSLERLLKRPENRVVSRVTFHNVRYCSSAASAIIRLPFVRHARLRALRRSQTKSHRLSVVRGLDQEPEVLWLLAIGACRELDTVAIRIVQGGHKDLGRCGDGRVGLPGEFEGAGRQLPTHLLRCASCL